MESPFLAPNSTTRAGQLATLHLSRDSLLPVKLSTTATTASEVGYAEGVVTNTKFGSFPHSTLIDIPWGCQVLASKVDTGTRGRTGAASTHDRKRKAGAISSDNADGEPGEEGLKQATTATSGFIHVLPPTPETWTTGLPHRTQVVYTPDYSYVLQRIRARPGSTLIEAGSGSGSFTHAAARAVFEDARPKHGKSSSADAETAGKVFTFEFHAERHEKVQNEMQEHGLESIVTATHRDVYKDGFWIKVANGELHSPCANCIFLDLPAPWEALPHLMRDQIPGRPSALDPRSTAYICTFSPCIEQVQKTVSTMRRHGWVEIEMVVIQHKRIEVKREYTGLQYEGMRGVNGVAVTVDEALERLHQVETNAREHQPHVKGSHRHYEATKSQRNDQKNVSRNGYQESAAQKHFDEGRLIHRAEPELKTHTSYLVFAILPREWTDQDEEATRVQLQQNRLTAKQAPKSQKQIKRELKHKKSVANGAQPITEAIVNGE